MQTKQLLVWIALTVLLHWSQAQEENIHEQTPGMEAGTTPSEPGELKSSEMAEQNDKHSTASESGDDKPKESSMGTADMPSPGEHLDLGPQSEADKQPASSTGTADMPSPGEHLDLVPQSGENKEEPAAEKPPMDTEDIPTKEEEKDPDEPSKGTLDIPFAGEQTEPPMGESDIPDHPKPVESEHKGTSTETEGTDKDKPPTGTEALPDPPAEDYQDDAPHEDPTEPTPATTQPTPATTKPPPTSALPVPLFPSISCFSCSNCKEKPKNRTKCASAPGKRNGCLTFVKNEEKLVLRGCISELAESGHNYCKSNAKGCEMCYENDCNAKEVTLSAAAPLLGSALIWAICIFRCLVTM